MSNSTILKIGISGKRFIPDKERDKVYREIQEKIQFLTKQYKSQSFIGYTALAIGADSLFAEVVKKEFNQPLQVILPFAQEEYEKDFKANDVDIFRNYIKEAGTYEVVSPVPANNESRNRAYFEAGKRIIDECNEVIIVWDGLKPGGTGGTAEMMGYLSETKKNYPIPLIKFKPEKKDKLNEELLHAYHTSNKLAITARNRYKRVWKWAIFMGWMTVICFALKTALRLEETLGLIFTSFEFLFVVAVYVLISIARKRNFHGEYLKQRLNAETCRLLNTFYHAGVQVGVSDQSKEEDPELATLAAKINQSLPDPNLKSGWYTQYVIKALINEQVDYHSTKIKTIGDHHLSIERINKVIERLFVINLGVHLVHLFISGVHAQDMWLYKLSVFFNIFLPACYAALEAVIYFNEWALLKKYSISAKSSLEETAQLLPDNLLQYSNEDCFKKQAQVLHLISSIMLTDNRNWNLLLENKDNYHLIV